MAKLFFLGLALVSGCRPLLNGHSTKDGRGASLSLLLSGIEEGSRGPELATDSCSHLRAHSTAAGSDGCGDC